MKLKDNLPPKIKNSIILITVVLISSLLFSSQTDSNYLTNFFNDLTGSISVDKTQVCINEEATITFKAENGVAPYTFTYELNGSTDTKKSTGTNNSVSFKYKNATPNDYVFILTKIVDKNNTSQSITGKQVVIKVNTPPTVGFTFNNNNSCSGETIQFTNTSTGEENLSYNWDFGDSTTSTQKDPTHIFEALGCSTKTFRVKLTVTDKNGCSASITKNIDVQEKPDISFFDDDLRNFDNCGNASTNYIINVGNGSNSSCIDSFIVDWGDGNKETFLPSSFPISHEYTKVAVYNLKIKATGDICENEVSYIVKNVSNPAGGLTGPGNTSNICLDNQPKGEGGAPDGFKFEINGFEANSDDTTYTMDFGDGSQKETFTHDIISNNNLIYHTYLEGSCSTPGNEFVAVLTIENACSTTTSTINNIVILEPSVAKFESDDNGCINTSILFNNKSIIGDNPNCTEAANFQWDFGDGTIVNDRNSSFLNNQTHIYTDSGNYTAILTVRSNCGSETFTKEICIEPEITPTFSVDNEEGCIPLAIATTNTTIETSLCSVPTYNWSISYNSDNCGTTLDNTSPTPFKAPKNIIKTKSNPNKKNIDLTQE